MPDFPSRFNLDELITFASNQKFLGILIIVCLTVGVTLVYQDQPPIVSTLFFGISVSCLVFAFLGGIDKNETFVVGGAKLSGSFGALVLFMWLFYPVLESQMDKLHKRKQITFDPLKSNWFILNNDGDPISVKLNDGQIRIDPPNDLYDRLNNNKLSFVSNHGRLIVKKSKNPTLVYGFFNPSSLISEHFHNDFSGDKKFFVTKMLEEDIGSQYIKPLSISISAGHFGDEYSDYVLSDKEDNVLVRGSLSKNQAHIKELQIKSEIKHILIAVVSVDHKPKETPGGGLRPPYVKFGLGEVEPKIILNDTSKIN